jgi:hypothetical protein
MPDLKVTATDFSPQFMRAIQSIGGGNFGISFPNTMAALNILAHRHLAQWRKATMGEQLPGMPFAINSRGDYTRSINVDMSDEQIKYVQSQGPWTERFEAGHDEIDLKPGLLSGPKARIGRNGPYNIVHFRHGVPDTLPSNNPMPINVYQIVKRETDKADRAYASGKAASPGTSRITGQGPKTIQRVSGKVDQARNYQWGYRLPASQGGPRKVKDTSQGQYQWKTGKRASMVRMDTSTSRAKSSSYMTFRTVSIHSDPASWIVPPKAANPIRQAVVDSLQKETETILQAAMEEDLKAGSA